MSIGIGGIALLFFGFFVVTFLATPGVMRFARYIGAVDRGGYRKVFEGAMPLLGGLGIAGPFIVGALLCSAFGYFTISQWRWVFTHLEGHVDFIMTLASSRQNLLVIALGGLAIVALGIVDDKRGMRPKWKLLTQLLVALFVSLYGHAFTTLSLPFIGTIDLGVAGGRLLTVLWVVGLINAFNLVDGIDGLASGIAFIAALAILCLGIIQANLFVVLASAALAGSTFAFLCYNFHPARIFLGDTGSMFLGYALATMSLVGAQKSETAAILIAPMLALGLPVFETFVSIVRRYINGVPVFAGDNRHTHHRLLLKGFSQPVAVVILCGAEFLLAGAAVISALIPNDSPLAWTPYLVYFATLGALLWLAEYGRPQTLKTLSARRQRNRAFQALGRYAALRLSDKSRSVDSQLLLEVCRQELGLLHLEAHFADGAVWAAAHVAHASENRERLRVKSSEDEDIIIWYAHDDGADATLRQDVSACLGAIFDGLRVAEPEEPLEAPPRDDADTALPVHYPAEGKLGLHDQP